MYTRGQFAVMGNVGMKALRLYHEEGILIPVYINENNGYHYYDEKQLETLEKIKQYRKLGLSLFEIRQIINGTADEEDILKSKINETDQLLSEMKAYRSSPDTDNSGTGGDKIDIRAFDRCKCIFITENTEREDLGISVGKLYERASRENLEIAGSHFVIFDHPDDSEGFTMKTCLPVRDHNGDDIMDVFEERCLHICFTGGFSNIRKAHQMLRRYADESGLKTSGRVYEVYNRDMSADVYYVITE